MKLSGRCVLGFHLKGHCLGRRRASGDFSRGHSGEGYIYRNYREALTEKGLANVDVCGAKHLAKRNVKQPS